MKCVASYPTEWVTDADTAQRNRQGRSRNEWTERNYKNSSYEYVAWINIGAKQVYDPVTFECRAVDNVEDSIILLFTPTKSPDGDTVAITSERRSGHHTRDFKPNADLPCEFMYFVTYVQGSGYFIRCLETTTESTGAIKVQGCDNAAFCANTFRKLKETVNTCVKMVQNSSESDTGWSKTDVGKNGRSGVAVCTIRETQQRAALEFFFTAPDKLGFRSLHFSWPTIRPEDMIQLKLPNGVYYSGQSIRAVCNVYKYGFSYEPTFITLLNGMSLTEDENFEENKDQRKWIKVYEKKYEQVGSYSFICKAPIWNTTEWANQTIHFVVKDGIPPYFEEPKEVITLAEGDKDKDVFCHAKGEPTPSVGWIVNDAFHGIKVKNNGTLIFLSVTRFVEGEYKCIATNSLGQTATKTLIVNIPSLNATAGTTTGIAIGISVLILILVVSGFTLFYFKYAKLQNMTVVMLSREEIEEFMEGKRNSKIDFTKEGQMEMNSTQFVESLAYNPKYELPKDKFQIDKSAPLGSGAFGIVYRGTVTTDKGTVKTAFKTVKREAEISYLKALLSELKILIYVEKHESIVNLIGAYTENLIHKEVYVAIELCECCLLNFLRDNSSAFLHYTENGDFKSDGMRMNPNYQNESTFSTITLLQWAHDLAAALEHISSKRIVHGDIAARNVLLTTQLQVKLCDFGLARQMIDYNYIKSEQCPLPWKWMAIESLSQMKFSAKSDVWAYGITLWEIFSLGDIPYPGLNWTTDFIKQLSAGLRMTFPPYASDEIYELMCKCWETDPDARPTFTTLKIFFANLLAKRL